ncbi:M28 family peptidase [Elongatibacter sediminis]|uniref:M28 family peptidase n=1 Tax=Elongatibacter sediminis TaxID=3119006 RepID=A0AAW9RDP8_9GAMM
MKKLLLLGLLTGGVLIVSTASAQATRDPQTLVSADKLHAMIDEISGAEAHAHVMEITPYERNRPASEYGSGTYREAAYMAKKAREVGLSEVSIERFPQAWDEWDAEMAELWIEQPEKKLITRYRDVTATLASGSRSADVRAEVVDVGPGDRETDYENRDVTGKLVLASGPVDKVHELAVLKFQAAGVLSYFNGSGKPEERPDQIAWGRLHKLHELAEVEQPDPNTTFGFILSHRMGTELVKLVRESENVVARAIVKTARHPADLQVVTAIIPGDGSISPSEKSEVVFIAHLFEGIAKQGANDNGSGPAVQLEMARSWLRLIEDGVLPQPKRTVRFLWVPEFTGTRAYIERYSDFLERLIGVINMDMVGANQSLHRHSLNVVTTAYSLPSFVNDLAIQFMEYVGDTNRSKVTNRKFGFGFRRPIFDLTGTRDPFWFHISRFSFGSDHQVFTEATPRVPSVAFNNFHDYSYHTSEDSPLLLDPTQMKRMALIGLAMGEVMANAHGDEALAVASLSAAYGQRRLGEDLTEAVMLLAHASAEDLHTTWKEARNLMHWAYRRELAGVQSSAHLIGPDEQAMQQLGAIEQALAAGQDLDFRRVDAAYAARCLTLGVAPMREISFSEEEKQARKMVPHRTAIEAEDKPSSGDSETKPPLAQYYALEAKNYADGKRSILEIRNAISAEYGPVELAKVMAFFRDLEQSNQWTIKNPGQKTWGQSKGTE